MRSKALAFYGLASLTSVPIPMRRKLRARESFTKFYIRGYSCAPRCISEEPAVKIETAISLIGVVMEALVHRQHCIKNPGRDIPTELLVTALTELEKDGPSARVHRYSAMRPQTKH